MLGLLVDYKNWYASCTSLKRAHSVKLLSLLKIFLIIWDLEIKQFNAILDLMMQDKLKEIFQHYFGSN